MIEVEVHNTDVEVVSEIGVESTGSVTAEVVDLGDLDITVAKKEYVITGDSIYVPVLYDDAPQWMKDLVSLTVDVSIETANASTLAQLSSILATFAISYVPLNQYTQSINSLALADTNMQAVIETLNSNFNDGLNLANSQIINLQTTKASKTEVVTQVIDTLAAQLTTPDSDIGAVISNINQAIANEATTRANSFNVLNTSLGNVGENVAGNSTAISGLQSSVTNINGTLSAQAGQITTLSNNLQSGSGTWATADTAVTNTLNSTITNGLATVESKWAYNSNIVINGNTYSSGFGLSNSAGTGVGSEFWINADKFKFTNNGKTGSKTPFSIEASGATPEIYFNGKVTFSNITNVPQLGSTPQEVVTAINNAQTTTINGPRITTGSITANQIQSNSVSADRLIAGTSGSTVWTNGGLVSQNFNGNVYGNIGSPTAGFRLSSGAAGTSVDPNIYGAYIKGGVIQGSTFIGALTETTVYHNFSATAPGNTTWKQVASFTAMAPTSGESFKLTASLTFGADGGNWPDVRFRVSFNSVLVLDSTSLVFALGGVSDTTLFIKSSTSYTSNVTVTVEAYQASLGYAYINTSSRISCMMMATSI